MRHARISTILALVAAASLAASGCKEKDSATFNTFAPGDGPSGVPGTSLEGGWTIDYAPVEDPCELVGGPFQAQATIDYTPGAGELSVSFADAPAPIVGDYDESTGAFEGTTEEVDLGGGTTAVETWSDVTFVLDPTRFENGTSQTDFTFSGGEMCPVTYRIDGTMEMPAG